jgi:hypothetical protein
MIVPCQIFVECTTEKDGTYIFPANIDYSINNKHFKLPGLNLIVGSVFIQSLVDQFSRAERPGMGG